MQRFTIDDLRRILRQCAGEEEQSLDGDILERSFDELGYDSLALLETTSRISKEFSVKLSDDIAAEVDTPGELLAFVNEKLAAMA
ncbi:acyl carrier protein [Nucisporomicrobium flavum]|uniref:acyl carrier protein n=1 Tax=Nucisporomicrobium flavum TaxID=2785915 RepID=UPI0018F72716|nr:acyl carrier protein [Nucisporomicrobium flavum]